MEFKEVDSNGIWAYDAVYELAMAVERVQTATEFTWKDLGNNIGTSLLLDEMLIVRFHGLGGEFKLMKGRIISNAMEVVNVIDKGDRRVGFWMMSTGEFVKGIGIPDSISNRGLQSIIWPGGTTSINRKRRKLQTNGNKKLRILFPNFGRFPNLVQVTVDPKTNLSGVSGFYGDVFSAAFNALDYGVGIEVFPFKYEVGITYNDLIQKIYRKEYDAAIGDFTITTNRSLYVDFTIPFTDLGVGIVARNAKNSMWIFLDPFSAGLWITSVCFFLFLGFVIWFIEHPTNKESQGSTIQQIGTTLSFAFSALVYAHREKLQSNLSRFVVIVWVFAVLVLTSSYTATLSSVLTVQQIGMNEISTGFQNLSPVGGYVFNKLKPVDVNLEKLYTPEDYSKALRNGRVDAIVSEILYIKSFLSMYPATDVSLIATASTTNGFGFAFQKGSPLAREVSTEIVKMREDGTLKALEDKWLKHESAVMSKDFSSPSPKILNLYRLRGLFVISGVSIALVLLVSMIHLVPKKWHAKNITKTLRSVLRNTCTR
ncbi:unnamed protein product [Lactuca saligna]|uniref:Glutamate receptor n=1 Tax=Lactuca saligna TaxID=75948 RepID=A0AA35ZY00_LACSI|nr:unnamed protein product [Lactuca saligna]